MGSCVSRLMQWKIQATQQQRPHKLSAVGYSPVENENRKSKCRHVKLKTDESCPIVRAAASNDELHSPFTDTIQPPFLRVTSKSNLVPALTIPDPEGDLASSQDTFQICMASLQQAIAFLDSRDGTEVDSVRPHLEHVARLLQTRVMDVGFRRKSAAEHEAAVPQMSLQMPSVPEDVRDWIETTFTRTQPPPQDLNAIQGRQKFKSVVNAIRVGIRVDRIHREFTSAAYEEISRSVQKTLGNWTFNIFQVNDISNSHPLKIVAFEIFKHYDFINTYKIPMSVLEVFLTRVEVGYSKYQNSYHNGIHAADVLQTCHALVRTAGLERHLRELELFAMMLAATIHDLEHTGTTNNFHINTGSELALLYNDNSVLENHHLSTAFKILSNPYANILQALTSTEYREVRTMVIEMVLSTDMSRHFQQMSTLQETLSFNAEVERCKVMSYLLHCADISHPGKEWGSHKRWVFLLLEEFFKQGDRERELHLAYSPLCDRGTTRVAQSQIGFIDFIVEPSFRLLHSLLERFTSGTSSGTSANSTQPRHGLQRRKWTTAQQSLTRHLSSAHIRRSNSDVDLRSVAMSASASYGKLILPRPWEACLVFNRHKWSKYKDEGDFTLARDDRIDFNRTSRQDATASLKKRFLAMKTNI